MKTIGITSTAVLSLLLTMAPVFAQQGEKQDRPEEQTKHEQAKPEQKPTSKQSKAAQKQQQPQHTQKPQEQNKPQERAQQPKPSDRTQQPTQRAQQPEKKAQLQEGQKNQPQHAQQKPSNEKQQKPQQAQYQRGNTPAQRTPEQQRVQQAAWQQHRSQNWDSDHRSWQQRGGYNGYRIPDDRFRGSFGQDHEFRISGLPFLVVGGYPRFQYEGFWFSMVDPWPQAWTSNWYDTDDVYVLYVDNGYYLFDRRYPNIGMAISISM